MKPATWKGIIKIQRSIGGNAGLTILVYNEDKSLLYEQEQSKQTDNLFVGNELKVYHYATLRKGVIRINERAPEQEW